MAKRKKLILSGNYAAAYAAKEARVEVIPIYPITPQTTVVEKLVEFVENGEMNAEIIHADSEHSAMAAAIGASAAGARVFTATASHGLLYMYEMVWWAANARLPIVAGFVTRAIGPPWNIWSDHNDFLSMRDCGWILMFASNAQEVFDLIIQAYKIAENPDIRLPVGVAWDGFEISHSYEPVEVISHEELSNFLPDPRNIKPILDVNNPVTIGNVPIAKDHMKYRHSIWISMERARSVIRKVMEEYNSISGRNYGKLLDEYRTIDADTIIVTMGAISGDAKMAINKLREKGERVGLARIRVIRPFPISEFIRLGKIANRLIIIDRNFSSGFGGIVANEVRALFYEYYIDTPIYNFLTGLAGTEVSSGDFTNMYMLVKERKVKPLRAYWYYHGGEYYDFT